MMRYIFMCLLAMLCYVPSFAQDVVFTATTNTSKAGIEDIFEIKYIIQNVQGLQHLSAVKDIEKDFELVGGPYLGHSATIVQSNGQYQQKVTSTCAYTIRAKRTGTLTIPAGIAVDGEGTKYRSNSVQIEIVKGSIDPRRQRQTQPTNPYAPPQASRSRSQQGVSNTEKVDLSKDLFLRVEVDDRSVYQGEQITASYKLYSRIPGYQFVISKLPSLNGFWTQDFIMPSQQNSKAVEQIIDGVPYQVLTLKKSALFPQQTGDLELDPTEVEGVARIIQRVNSNPFGNDPNFQRMMQNMFMDDPSMYDNMFSRMVYRDIPVTLKSKPVSINVLALPDTNKPESFTGGVGQFKLSSSIDKTDATTDDVITLKLEITGTGNIKLINPPILNLPNGITTYDPQVLDTITERTTNISGVKIITYTITPQTPGKYEIPSIPFSYFDPNTKKYITISSKPISVNVTAGKTYKPEQTVNKILTDLHAISTTSLNNGTNRSIPIIYSVGYWALYAVPLFSFIGLLVWKRREDDLSNNSALLKNKRANKIALKRLKIAQKLLQTNKRSEFYEEVSKAIWLYLSDKLHIPISNLSKDNVWGALSQYSIDQPLQNQLNTLITECETALYAASSGSEMKTTFNKAVETISKLEESFKK